MAKGKGSEAGYGTGDNVHSGTGSKGSGGDGYKLPQGKTNRSPGASAVSSNNGGGSDETFAKGGNTKMFGHQAAESQHPAGTEHDTGSDQSTGTGDRFACGGKGKMFGYNPSVPARAGITSAR